MLETAIVAALIVGVFLLRFAYSCMYCLKCGTAYIPASETEWAREWLEDGWTVRGTYCPTCKHLSARTEKRVEC